MESNVLPSYPKHCHNFKCIPFVTASEKLNENPAESVFVSGINLNGEEASIFYNEVISSPSSVILPKASNTNQHTQKPKTNCTSFKKHNSRLTIFHHSQDGNVEGLEYCISKGCDVNIQDIYGWTPMMCASFEGHSAVIEYLIKNGASLSIKNKQGQTALDIATAKNHKSLFMLLSEGVIENVIGSKNEVEEETKYCNLCHYSYTGPIATHESSITHLLSCKKDNITTFYHIPENNKGFQIMLKNGWDKNQGLGINATGRKFPIKTVLKKDRTCIGGKKEVPKVTHFGPNDDNSVKEHNQPSVRLIREKTLKKWQVKKLESKNRRKEIDFRRQFNMEM